MTHHFTHGTYPKTASTPYGSVTMEVAYKHSEISGQNFIIGINSIKVTDLYLELVDKVDRFVYFNFWSYISRMCVNDKSKGREASSRHSYFK